jgi:hypothetical protein
LISTYFHNDAEHSGDSRKEDRMGIFRSIGAAILIGLASQSSGPATKMPYGAMAPLEQYLIGDRQAEISFARSAAPPSISREADVLVLGRQGFQTAVKGTNGFACLVQRSWSANIDDVDFWNPRLRSPICFNPPAARSYMPLTIRRTELVLTGQSKDEMFASLSSAVEHGQLPTIEPNAMCYMMSKDGYLSTRDGRWHPHLMIFAPLTDPTAWGAGMAGSPVIAFTERHTHTSVFLIPVGHWSDGTPAPEQGH